MRPDETPVAVLDFETSGGGPLARATEIAVVRLEGGRVVDRFASLMHTGVDVPPFIEQLTGISAAMLASAPPAGEVMQEALRRTQGCTLIAHNAPFDRGFWIQELRRVGVDATATPFLCTVRLARRLLPEAPNHRLGTLARVLNLPDQGRAHRALADALTTTALWLHLVDAASRACGLPADAELLGRLQSVPLTRWPAVAQRVNKARFEASARARQGELAC